MGFTNAVVGTENGYTNSRGINLNRNYENGFSPSLVNGSSPFSEVETQYVKAMIENNLGALCFIDFHTNGTTITTSNYKYNNWISLRKQGDFVLNHAAQQHILNITRNICRKNNINYTDLGIISASDTSGMAKDYADLCGISSHSFEGSHRFPYTEVSEFTPSTNAFNVEIFINWLGCVLSEYKKYTM